MIKFGLSKIKIMKTKIEIEKILCDLEIKHTQLVKDLKECRDYDKSEFIFIETQINKGKIDILKLILS